MSRFRTPWGPPSQAITEHLSKPLHYHKAEANMTIAKPFMNVIHRLPVNIVSGDGVMLTDTEGNRYIDLWGDEGVASLGYGQSSPFFKRLREFAETGTLQRLPDMYHNDTRTSVAARLADRAKYDRVFFCNSGAEANEAAIKLARRYWSKIKDQPKRHWIFTLEGNFHGRTGFALAASDSQDSPYHKDGYGIMAGGFGVIGDDLDIEKVRMWDCYGDLHDSPAAQGAYTNGAFEEADWSEVAAVMMAPILGNNVVKTYPAEFWAKLAQLQDKHGFLIIFDEVQVGMGRTGAFCAHHNPKVTGGVRPHICALGKGIAGGLPCAAILADDEIARAFIPGVHFSTFGGTLLVMEMIDEVINWLDAGMWSIANREVQIKRAFADMVHSGLLKSFDGAGVHWGFTPHWGMPGDSPLMASSPKFTGPMLCDVARDFGILMVTHRDHGPIRFTPPLTITEFELGAALDALRNSLKKLSGNG